MSDRLPDQTSMIAARTLQRTTQRLAKNWLNFS
jgi:hypothetical protein